MSITGEIEELNAKLEQTADEREQAEVLMEILKIYHTIYSGGSEPYIDQLLHIADKLDKPLYKAWGLFYLANLKKDKSDFLNSIDIGNQVLDMFRGLNEKSGIAMTHSVIGNNYRKMGDYQEATKNLLIAQNYFTELDDKVGIAGTNQNIGICYCGTGDLKKAEEYFHAALKLREEIGDQNGISKSHMNFGNVYDMQGNYVEALKSHFKAIEIMEQTGNKTDIARCYINIGSCYRRIGKYAESIKSLSASLDIMLEIDDKSGAANTYSSLGTTYLDQGDYSKALEFYLASLKINEVLNAGASLSDDYNCVGAVYLHLQNYPEALNYYKLALNIRIKMGDKRGLANSYDNIGSVYYEEGNYTAALEAAFSSLSFSEETQYKESVKINFLALSKIYKALSDYENALIYHEKYHQVESEMLGEESTKQLNNLSFMHNLEQKEKNLEIEQLRNVELKKERDRSESLLLNILPAEVAEELKEKGTADAKHFNDVTVLFTDFKGFTTVSERLSPQQLVDELHACFSAFDHIMQKYGIEKIKTVGDAYLAVSGLPQANADHASDIVNAAIEIRDYMLARKRELGDMTFEIRIGVHSGSVVAGIVGVKKFAYDIWGDTVNTAARMEQNSEAGKINISETTYQLVKDKFSCEYRGEIEAKNKGKLKMYFVE